MVTRESPEAGAPAGAEMAVPRRPLPARRHRGGSSWKVAYADFVTAMMALFIVLWLVNSSQNVRNSVGGYFRDPRGWTHKQGAGPAGSGEGLTVRGDNVRDLQGRIEQALRSVPELSRMRGNIAISATGEGLRIELLENREGTFFVTGSAAPTDAARRLLGMVAGELTRLPNSVVIEGHTDSLPFRNNQPGAAYTNWELSTDRAHAARRMMYDAGIPTERIAEVRGFADRRLMSPQEPTSPRNRRVSLVVRFGGK